MVDDRGVENITMSVAGISIESPSNGNGTGGRVAVEENASGLEEASQEKDISPEGNNGDSDDQREALLEAVDQQGEGKGPRDVLELIAGGVVVEPVDKKGLPKLELVIAGGPELDQLLKSPNPNKRALGLDFKKALLQKNLGLIDKYEEKKQITSFQAERYRDKIQEQIVEIERERKELTDQGVEQNQVEQAASLLAGDEEEEKEFAQSDPLGFLEKKLNQGMRNMGERKVLFNLLREKLGISDEIIGVLDDKMSQVLKEEGKQQREKIMKNLKSGGIISLLLILLSAWAAKKIEDGQR